LPDDAQVVLGVDDGDDATTDHFVVVDQHHADLLWRRCHGTSFRVRAVLSISGGAWSGPAASPGTGRREIVSVVVPGLEDDQDVPVDEVDEPMLLGDAS